MAGNSACNRPTGDFRRAQLASGSRWRSSSAPAQTPMRACSRAAASARPIRRWETWHYTAVGTFPIRRPRALRAMGFRRAGSRERGGCGRHLDGRRVRGGRTAGERRQIGVRGDRHGRGRVDRARRLTARRHDQAVALGRAARRHCRDRRHHRRNRSLGGASRPDHCVWADPCTQHQRDWARGDRCTWAGPRDQYQYHSARHGSTARPRGAGFHRDRALAEQPSA